MKCERAKELFSEYVEGSIDYALTATVRSHINQCHACRTDLKSFLKTWDAIGTLPEVEPPSSFRHDAVMRAARLQHEQRKPARYGFVSAIRDSGFGRLTPVRAIAIATAGAALAVVALSLSSVMDGKNPLLSALGRLSIGWTETVNDKDKWLSKRTWGNKLWVSLEVREFGPGSVYYEVVLEINNKALPEIENKVDRIACTAYVLPPNNFGLDDGDLRGPVWAGDVRQQSPVHIAVPGISSSSVDPTPVTLLIRYQLRTMSFSKIVFIPTENSSGRSSDAMNLYTGSVAKSAAENLYSSLQSLSQRNGVAVIANVLRVVPSMPANLKPGKTENVMRELCSDEGGLAWAFIDNAIYVDRWFQNAED